MIKPIYLACVFLIIGAGFLVLIDAEFLFSSYKRSGYEESCNKTLKCKRNSFFSCHSDSKICLCFKPEAMTYNKSLDKCVVLLGERCAFGYVSEEINQISFYGDAPCVGTAVCTNDVCSCPPGSHKDLKLSLCHPSMEFNGNCSREAECNELKMLRCTNGSCTCDPNKSVINPSDKVIEEIRHYESPYSSLSTITKLITHHLPERSCLSKVGQYCSFLTQQFCVNNAECMSNICECYSPNKLTPDGLCRLGHGKICESSSYNDPHDDDTCAEKLVCSRFSINNESSDKWTICSCPNPEFQEYDSETETCRSRVGALCDKDELNSCAKRSSCVQDEQGTFRCVCNKGFIVNDKFECEIAHGKPCNYNRYICDTLSGLECRNGKCSCPNELDVFEEDKRLCSTRAGQSCKTYEECVSNSNCTIKLLPITGKTIPEKCECLPGYKGDGTGFCKADSETTDQDYSKRARPAQSP